MVGKDHQWQQGALMAVAVVVLRLLLLVVGDSYKGEWISAVTTTLHCHQISDQQRQY